jgi:fatty-acyl-CoA synthase
MIMAINTRFREHEVGDLLGRGAADWLIMWPEFKGIPFGEIIGNIPADRLARLKGVVQYQVPERVHNTAAFSLPNHAVHAFASLLDTPISSPLRNLSGEEGVIAFSTSGTTSLPKLVLHCQRTLIEHGRAVANALAYDDQTCVLASTPFCGAFGFATLMGTLVAGTKIISEPVFTVAGSVRMVHEHRVTHTFANNESIAQMLDISGSPEDFLSAQYFGFASFTPAADSFVMQAAARNLPVAGLYGSSELMALAATQPLGAATTNLPGGKLTHPNARVRCRDQASNAILPHGQSGELEIQSPCLFMQYLDDQAATASAMTEDGYFRTGDMGYTISDKHFVFQARMGDSFRLAGFLVNPAEIESVIETLLGIKACQVVGANVGNRVVPFAFVLLAPGAQSTVEAWTSTCKERMASFKVPVEFHVMEKFPVILSANASKIQKGKLRELAESRLASSHHP